VAFGRSLVQIGLLVVLVVLGALISLPWSTMPSITIITTISIVLAIAIAIAIIIIIVIIIVIIIIAIVLAFTVAIIALLLFLLFLLLPRQVIYDSNGLFHRWIASSHHVIDQDILILVSSVQASA